MSVLDDLYSMFVGILNAGDMYRQFGMDSVAGRIIIKGELFDAVGTIKHGFASFDSVGRAFRITKLVNDRGVKVLYIDESSVKNNPEVMYKVLKANIGTTRNISFTSALLIALVSTMIGGMGGFMLGTVGWKIMLIFATVLMAFIIIIRGRKYVR